MKSLVRFQCEVTDLIARFGEESQGLPEAEYTEQATRVAEFLAAMSLCVAKTARFPAAAMTRIAVFAEAKSDQAIAAVRASS